MNKARRIKIEKDIYDLEDILERVKLAEIQERNHFTLMCLENAKCNLRIVINNLLEGIQK